VELTTFATEVAASFGAFDVGKDKGYEMPSAGEYRVGGWFIVMLAFVALLLGCDDGSAPRPDADPIPLGVTLDGDTLSTADFRGRVVLVVLWATWCGPCQLAFADLDTLAASLSPSDPVAIVAVSLDGAEGALEAYVQGQNHAFDITRDASLQTASQFGVRGIPAYLILDRHGFRKSRLLGYQSWQSVQDAITGELLQN
jgi:thiol-disulfide isomerase/thioredoxin